MKKILISVLIIIALAFSALLFFRNSFVKNPENYSDKKSVSIKGEIFSLEIASSPADQAKGLSGRQELCSRCAMLFVFTDSSVRNFWMKDMQFDLDMLWISGSEIVKISRNISHEKGSGEAVDSGLAVDKVIELNAGTSDRLQLQEGDQVIF